MLWYDTATNTLKMRSEANDAWIDLGTLDQSANTFLPALVSPALTGVPTAPTAVAGTDTTQIATTEFVQTVAAHTTGSYTATLTPISGTITLNALGQTLYWTRTGDLIHVHGYIYISANSSPTGLVVLNLPFTPKVRGGVSLSSRHGFSFVRTDDSSGTSSTVNATIVTGANARIGEGELTTSTDFAVNDAFWFSFTYEAEAV